MTSLDGKDILSADQFTLDEIRLIMDTAAHFEGKLRAGSRLTNMTGKVLVTLFYEPSTRTRLCHESAMVRLGGQVISAAEAQTTSSAAKGETLFDTGRVISSYADVAVIRHHTIGSAQELAEGASIPVINGGDGKGEHPTQALLDLYTIQKEKGRVDGLTITLAGDLRHTRAVHSLSALLANFRVGFYFVSPLELRMPEAITAAVRERGADVVETANLLEAVAESDVLYVVRIKKERFDDPNEAERLKDSYVIVDLGLVKVSKPGITIMHPLPRVGVIREEVDTYEGAAYFRQAANGVPVRMALLTLVTGCL